MATKMEYKPLIKQILEEYASLKPAYGDIDSRVVFDDEHGSYALMQVGWHGSRYVHGAIIHIEVIGDKVWIQYDGTEDGIASELVEAGIPKKQIVLGFRPEQVREYTGFAVR